jgi:hypothetical protein
MTWQQLSYSNQSYSHTLHRHQQPTVTRDLSSWTEALGAVRKFSCPLSTDLPPHFQQQVEESGDLLSDKLDKVKPSAIIYLEAPVEVCLERIHQKGRKEEQEVTLEYLHLIQQKYEETLSEFPGPVICIADSTQPAIHSVLKDTWSALSSLNNTLRPFDHTTSLRSAKPECYTSQQQYTSQALTTTRPFYSQNEVPVLSQAQPGRFNFSHQFRNRYRETYGTDPDSSHRIGNAVSAVEVYCRVGTTASRGEGAYIRLATVLAEAAAAIEIIVEADGTEKVTINDHQYALSSYLATPRKDPLLVRNHAWYSMFFNEAKSLSRKIKPHNQQKDLATDSTVPNSNTSPSAQINMLEDHPSPSPKRRCHTVPVAIKSSPVIDPSLPCEICQDPDDWEN